MPRSQVADDEFDGVGDDVRDALEGEAVAVVQRPRGNGAGQAQHHRGGFRGGQGLAGRSRSTDTGCPSLREWCTPVRASKHTSATTDPRRNEIAVSRSATGRVMRPHVRALLRRGTWKWCEIVVNR
jgi:hypothetical protein